MTVTEEKPVVTASAVSSAVTTVLLAVFGLLTAFDVWHPTDAQIAAVLAVIGAVTVAVNTVLGKAAASRVFVPSSVATIVQAAEDTARAEGKASVVEQIKATAPTNLAGTPPPVLLPQTPYQYHPIVGPVGGRDGTEGRP